MRRSHLRCLSVILSVFVLSPSFNSATEARCRRCGRCRPVLCVVGCQPVCLRDCDTCRHEQRIAPTPAPPEHVSRVLARGSVVSPKSGKRFEFVETDDPGTEEDLESELASKLNPAERMAASHSPEFAGHDRKAAKTSTSDAPVEDQETLEAVLASLPDDDQMLHHHPKITEAEDSDRVDEEERNVHFYAYLYATKREADNDYHIILGSTKSPTDSEFMTAEVSGLPRTGPDRTKLKAVRKEFEDEFIDNPIGTRYRTFQVPIRVEVTGSLFFDVDHPAGVVGPDGLKPNTAWEVHPVTKIVFEP
jgi:hypothetical protein